MKRFLSLFTLLCAVAIVSCKSTGELVDPDAGNVSMKAPPPGMGIQIAIQPFDVPTDSEVQGNFYFKLPSDLPFNVGRIEIAMNEGTHHMNMYKSTVNWPKDSGTDRPVIFTHLDGKVDTVMIKYQAEFNATIVRNGGDMMVEAQIPYLNWVLPKLADGKQSVVHFEPNQTLIVENHYVNFNSLPVSGGTQTSPNGKGKVIINLWKDTSGLTPELSSMMFARQTHLSIPPNADYTITKDCFFPGVSTYPLSILSMTGHFHALGKKFWADKRRQTVDNNGNVIADTLIQANIYESSAWNEPPFTVYSTPIVLNAGEYIRFGANYVNTTNKTVLFGAHVATQEHCNLFVWFAPGVNGGATVYDDK